MGKWQAVHEYSLSDTAFRSWANSKNQSRANPTGAEETDPAEAEMADIEMQVTPSWETSSEGTGPGKDDPSFFSPTEEGFDNYLKELINNPAEIATATDQMNNNLKPTLNKPDRGISIPFILFGDLVDALLYSVANYGEADGASPPTTQPANGQFSGDQPRIILGSVSYPSPRSGKIIQMPISDIPVSINVFLSWFNQFVINSGGSRDFLTVQQFLNELLRTLLGVALGERCGNTRLMSTEVEMQELHIPKALAEKMYGSGKGGYLRRQRSEVLNSGADTSKGVSSFFVRLDPTQVKKDMIPDISKYKKRDVVPFYYMYGTGLTSANLQGSQFQDQKNGILWYFIGRDRGLVKRIEFSKESFEALQSANVASEGCEKILREMYNADIHCFGQPQATPGQYVYIIPSPMWGNASNASSWSHLIGIGGYFQVVDVSGRIDKGGNFDTILKCRWQQFGADLGVDPIGTPIDPNALKDALDELLPPVHSTLGSLENAPSTPATDIISQKMQGSEEEREAFIKAANELPGGFAEFIAKSKAGGDFTDEQLEVLGLEPDAYRNWQNENSQTGN